VAWSLPTNAREITEIIPLHDVEIALDNPYPESSVTGRDLELRPRVEGRTLIVDVPLLHVYGAVVIEPAGSAPHPLSLDGRG